MTRRVDRRVGPGLAIAALALVAGACSSGHGTYTQAHKDNANERMAQIKSGTEWDLAQQQFKSGALEPALEGVRRSIALNPNVPKARVLEARILIEMGRGEAALAALGEVLAMDPDNVDAHYYTGIVFERFDRHADAVASYLRAAEAAPDDPQYLVAAAEMMIEQGDVERAARLLEASHERFPYNAGVQQMLGHVAMMRGDAHDGLRLFSDAALLAPEDPSILEDLLRAQIAVGAFADADATATRLLADAPAGERPDLQLLKARCLIELGRPVDARSILTALSREPDGVSHVNVWLHLATIALEMGDDRRLRESARRLMAVAPDRFEGYYLLAMWQRNTGDLDGALRSVGLAAARAEGDPLPMQMKALLEHEAGHIELAHEAATEALRLDPESARARALLKALTP